MKIQCAVETVGAVIVKRPGLWVISIWTGSPYWVHQSITREIGEAYALLEFMDQCHDIVGIKIIPEAPDEQKMLAGEILVGDGKHDFNVYLFPPLTEDELAKGEEIKISGIPAAD